VENVEKFINELPVGGQEKKRERAKSQDQATIERLAKKIGLFSKFHLSLPPSFITSSKQFMVSAAL
jgi:hypothetical protein